MKIWRYFGLAVLLQACALSKNQQLFEVKMMAGDVLYATSQPRKDNDGFYRFKDVNQQSYVVQEKLILYINPVQIKR